MNRSLLVVAILAFTTLSAQAQPKVKPSVDADHLTKPKTLEEAKAQIAALVEARIVDKITSDIKCSMEKKQIIKALRNHQNVNYADNAPAEASGGSESSHPNTQTPGTSNPNTQTSGSKLPGKANN